ncbi:MAG: aminopeptidase P family protein [Pseudorhodoplanes sp.]
MFKAVFQTFEEQSDPAATPARVAALRAELKRRGLTGFIVPRADRHQNEYVPPCDERLAFLTGFTGSSGCAVVLLDRAAVFVDGRYTLQAADQIDTGIFKIEHLIETPPEQWIAQNLPAGGALGYDPWLHTIGAAEKLAKACEQAKAKLSPAEPNPVDAVWPDRPPPPLNKVVLYPQALAGEDARAKLERIRKEIGDADALVVSDPHALAWTFNIRGGDVAHTPIALAFAMIPKDGRPSLYVDGRKLDDEVRHGLESLADIREPGEFERDLVRQGGDKRTLRVDQATAADALSRLVTQAGGHVTRGSDPIAGMKAVKNAIEIEGTRQAHRRDGAAVARFLAWFAREAPSGNLTEIDAVEALETFRRETGALKDVSFPTIAGAGPNGAIVHYRVTRKTNRRIEPDSLFLIDSGAQYEDGTTDITRTLAAGAPNADMRTHFTLVLKGHIAIARAVFPDGVNGAQLDPFARRALWERGLDFDHGTGHGVGHYLSVHEGPARISKLGAAALKRGMILSNEPGYYRTGAYGIRIENLVLVTEAPKVEGAEKPLNAFETLTLAPIEANLIDVSLLDPAERAWIDAYHRRVRALLSPLLDRETVDWLGSATEPLREAASG